MERPVRRGRLAQVRGALVLPLVCVSSVPAVVRYTPVVCPSGRHGVCGVHHLLVASGVRCMRRAAGWRLSSQSSIQSFHVFKARFMQPVAIVLICVLDIALTRQDGHVLQERCTF